MYHCKIGDSDKCGLKPKIPLQIGKNLYVGDRAARNLVSQIR